MTPTIDMLQSQLEAVLAERDQLRGRMRDSPSDLEHLHDELECAIARSLRRQHTL